MPDYNLKSAGQMTARIKTPIVIILSILAIVSAILYFGITIPLGFMDAHLETVAGRLLDREVTIEEPPRLTISLHPALTFGKTSIANPRGWQEDSHFVTAEKGKCKVDLLSLLKGSIRIQELALQGVDLHLVTRADHETNFRSFGAGPTSDAGTSRTEFAGLDHVSLRDIRASYADELSGKKYILIVDNARGRGLPGHPLMLSAEGTFSGLAYSLEIIGGPLNDLIQGEEPWPLKGGKLAIGDISLDLSGAIGRNVEQGVGFVDLVLSGGNLEALGKTFGLPMPEMGDFSVNARIGLRPGMFHVTQLKVATMSSRLHGDLVFSLHGERPTLAGNITIPTLDPRLLSRLKSGNSAAKNGEAPEIENVGRLPWEMLKFVDADLHLLVEKVVVDPLRVAPLRAVVSLVSGDLILPVFVTVMDTHIGGRMEVFTDVETPEVNLSIDSTRADLAPLLAAFEMARKYSGRIGSLSLTGSTRGHNLKELAEALDLRITLGPTNLITESGPMFAADGLTFEQKPGQSFSLSAGGDFLSRPFNLKLRTRSAKENPGIPAGSLNLQLEACDTHLLFDATRPTDQQNSVTGFQFSIEGKELCGFLDPVGDFIHQATDFSVSGKGGLRPGSFFMELAHIRLGDIVADGVAELKTDSQGEPLIEAKIHSDSFDLRPFLPGIATGAANTGNEVTGTAGTQKAGVDNGGGKTPEQQIEAFKQLLTKQLLPQKHLLATDALLHFQLDQLETGRGRIANIKISANVKDGKLTPSPFQAELAGTLFKGNADMDLTGEVPVINLDLASNKINLPDLFNEFKLGPSPNITADHVSLDFALKGNNAKELLRRSSHEMTIHGGRWELERELSEPLWIEIERAVYSSTPETPTKITLTGAINAEPLSLELIEDGLFSKGQNKPFSVRVKAALADAVLSIDGKVFRDPGKDSTFWLNTTLAGERMNSLNQLFGFDLPPLGPYKITGALDNEGKTLNFHDLMLQIGRSALEGAIVISSTRNETGETEFPIHLETRLNARSIQLNDFQFGDWSPMKKGPEAVVATEEGAAPVSGKEPGDPIKKLNALLSPELANKIEGSLNIQVGEVLSGNDKLGSGQLNAKLENGRYLMDQLRLDIPSGVVRIQGSLKPEPSRMEARLAIQIENMDYGILIRRALPDSDLKGVINLNLDVNATAENSQRLNEHLNGHLWIGVV
ncbi:MAG: hypothetical protein V2I56_00835, partial [Desulfobacteraceae bacterium]|nr:hypothetical protein [Desulfobacteraceae bacterium]